MKIQIFSVFTILILSLSFSQIPMNKTGTENVLSKEENLITSLQAESNNLLDTIYDNPPNNGVTDIANMFNERGFYKSNGFSFDEQEIINDFNGNLIYNIPLYNYKLSGNLNFDLSLNYNGSVGHQIFIGNLSSYENGNFREI